MKGDETPLLLHCSTLETFIEETDSETDVYTHSFFLNLSGQSILNEDVSRIGSQFISAIGNLRNDLHNKFER